MNRKIDSFPGADLGSRLLVRPSAYCDEWLEGYVQRVIAVNGLYSFCIPQLDVALRTSCSDLLEEQQRRVLSVVSGYGQGCFGPHEVPVGFLVGSSVRCQICAGCVRECRYIRMIWRCARFETCPRHRQRLLSRCPGCSVKLGLVHAVDGRCPCGWSVAAVDDVPDCSEQACDLVDAMWGPLLLSGATTSAEGLGAALFASDFLARLVRRRRGRDLAYDDTSSTEYASRWLIAAGLEMRAGVEGITGLLSSLTEPIHLAFAAEYLERMRTSELERATVMSSLPLTDWQGLVASAGAPPRRSRLMGMPAALARNAGLLTYAEVARSAGIPYRLVAQEVKAAGLTPSTMVRARRTYRCLTPEQMQILRSKIEPRPASISTRFLGLDRTGTRKVQKSGVLRRLTSDTAGLLRLDDWIRLDSDLRASAVSGTIVKHAVRLSERRFWEWAHGDALRTVVDDIRRGRHRLFVDPRASGLSAYLVGPEVVWELRRLSSFRKSKLAHDGQHELFDLPASS